MILPPTIRPDIVPEATYGSYSRPIAKHGSWLNMAETEINVMNGQCLDRRMDDQSLMAEEIAAWEEERNARKARIHWTFTIAAARQKLRKLYPSI